MYTYIYVGGRRHNQTGHVPLGHLCIHIHIYIQTSMYNYMHIYVSI